LRFEEGESRLDHQKSRLFVRCLLIVILISVAGYRLEPPTKEQIKKYKQDGTYAGRVAYINKYLELNKNYVYTIEAVDCYGRVITYSAEERQSADLNKNKIARLINKRG